ncbi:histidine kinase [Tenacibaculum sp. MAR_2010_89]|uniref:histidine kinase n=1 Tax=Tenacibaculum sp. MAR_2010_89 TaxID=1250198 RepID=UPI000A6B31C8|nr:histidine kinase [Tenacibaculum sp. MAR_2010_89]
MKKIIVVICFLIAMGCFKKQDKVIFKKLPSYFNDKIAIGLSQDSLAFYLEKLKGVSKEGISDSLKAEFSYISSRFNNRLKKHDLAIEDLKDATSFTKNRIKNDREVSYFRALSLTYYSYKEDYLNAEGVNEKLFTLLNEYDYKNKASVYRFRQKVKAKLKEYDKALKANDSAAAMFLKVKDSSNYVLTKIGRSSIYSSLGSPKRAIRELTEVVKHESYLRTEVKYELYATLGYYYFNSNLYNKAILAYSNALTFSKKLPIHLSGTRNANNYVSISKSYIKLKKIDLAKKYVDSIFYLGLNNIDHINQRDALKTNLEILYKKNKDIGEVTSQLDSIYAYQEKNYANRVNSELETQKELYKNKIVLEKEKKKIEIQNLKYERNQYVLIALLLFGIMIGVLVLYFFRQRKFKIEQQNFLLHQRLLRSQMNPHFTFNSLSLIKNSIEEDSPKSIKYIQKFSRLLRTIFENSTKDYVPIEDELQSLQDYIELQQFRFPERFNFLIDNTIGAEDEVFIPPMLLQPFVENAIIHGFGKTETTGNLIIKLIFNEKYICCIIDDDGIGIDENNVDKRSSVKLIDDFLKKMTGEGITVVNKKELGKGSRGTKVELKIPYNIL